MALLADAFMDALAFRAGIRRCFAACLSTKKLLPHLERASCRSLLSLVISLFTTCFLHNLPECRPCCDVSGGRIVKEEVRQKSNFLVINY